MCTPDGSCGCHLLGWLLTLRSERSASAKHADVTECLSASTPPIEFQSHTQPESLPPKEDLASLSRRGLQLILDSSIVCLTVHKTLPVLTQLGQAETTSRFQHAGSTGCFCG